MSEADAPMVVDHTTAASLLQRPLNWGAAAARYSLRIAEPAAGLAADIDQALRALEVL